ncbi:MAG TPA: hypothetical protein VFO39_11780 [Candidatus Sulfotelmatobacter sp.]|nr:hypothetical protein [Candidatus Sulfotelmatobacter sp.]
MKPLPVLALSLALSSLLAPASNPRFSLKASARPNLSESYGKLPLAFEANQGQTDRQVKFLSRGAGYSLFLTSNEAVLSLREASGQSAATGKKRALPVPTAAKEKSAVLRMKLIGVNAAAEVVGQEELPGKSNYFVGKDPSRWRTNVPQYAKVRYENVYPGVDLVYYGNQQQLEYDFVVQPGIDPDAIRLKLDGAKSVRLEQGEIVVASEAGDVYLRRPTLYQDVNGAQKEVRGDYVMRGENEIGFTVGAYDRGRRLVIDPVLGYATALSGTNGNSSVGGDCH